MRVLLRGGRRELPAVTVADDVGDGVEEAIFSITLPECVGSFEVISAILSYNLSGQAAVPSQWPSSNVRCKVSAWRSDNLQGQVLCELLYGIASCLAVGSVG